MPGFEQRAFGPFPGGMFRNGPRESIPDTALYEALNALLDDEGYPSRRGGSAYKSPSGTTAVMMLWDGTFNAGQRTLWAYTTGNGSFALDVDDASRVAAGPQGLAVLSVPVKVGNYLATPFGSSATMWAGSRKTTAYSTGTVSISPGSRVLTGAGTSWLANVDAGMILFVSGKRIYTVQSVDSNTQITLDDVWTETALAGSGYTLSNTVSATLSNVLVPVSNPKLASVVNRLAYSAGNQVGLSDINYPFGYTSGNYLRFPGTVLALTNVRETLLVFTTGGMYAISGLASATPSDAAGNAQWRYELANAELIAWSHEGIAAWAGSAIVPCLDGVWLVDPVSGPKLLSKNITDLWRSYSGTSGYKTGGAAVYKGHYFLPILDSSNGWVDTLVCRLDTAAWTRLAGSGGKATIFAARRSSPQQLLGGDVTTNGRVFRFDYFQPSGSIKADHDGSAHQMTLEGKDTATGGGVKNTVVSVRGTYELVDAASDNPTMTLEIAKDNGAYSVVKGAATGGDAPEDDGSHPFRWATTANAKFIRWRLKTVGAAASAKLHSLELFVRRSGRQ